MFGWLKHKLRRPVRSTLTTDAAIDAVARYGAIMEQQGTAVLDVSKLPLPKAEMKMALKVAWRAAPDANVRNGVEHGYLNLANFQEGVGDEPVDCRLAQGVDLARDAPILERWLAWSEKVETEMNQLLVELNEFKQAALDE